MQIHELNTFSGTLGANDYFATDNGADTSKISATDLYAPLNARIDNIIAGPASSAQEVIDARLGADGVTYGSLGEAIRGQVSDLTTDLDRTRTNTETSFSHIFESWVSGTLNPQGEIVAYAERTSTNDFYMFDHPVTIINLNSTKHLIYCTYDSSYALISRNVLSSTKLSIPANTIFRLTVWLNDSAPLTDPYSVAKNLICLHEKVVDHKSETLEFYALGNGKALLDSDYINGNLDASGALDFSSSTLNKRITFYQYMKCATNNMLHIDFPYTVIVCLYNNDLSLASRTVYSAAANPTVIIPANTLFRVCIYLRDSSADITDVKPFLSAVYFLANPNAIPNLIAILESFAVIGDSLSCGFVGTAQGNISSNEAREAGRNWVNYLSLDINRPFTNLARGNSTARDWRYGNSSLDVDISTADIDTYCYMLAVGVNDARQGLTVGTSADIASNKANNADSFYGNYDFVVRQLIEYKNNHLSQTKIFVFTIPSTESNAETYNAAIRYIASLYKDVCCIDLYNLYYYEFLNSPFNKTWGYGHSRPIGYMMIANMIKCGVNIYMIDHINLFLLTPWPPIS